MTAPEPQGGGRRAPEAGNRSVLWELDPSSPAETQVTWFEKCRPKRIQATPAAIVVVVERLVDTWAESGQDGFGEELQKLGRGA